MTNDFQEWKDSQMENIEKMIDFYNHGSNESDRPWEEVLIESLDHIANTDDEYTFFRLFNAMDFYLERTLDVGRKVSYDIATFQLIASHALVADKGYSTKREFMIGETYGLLCKAIFDERDASKVSRDFDSIDDMSVQAYLFVVTPRYYAEMDQYGPAMHFIRKMVELRGHKMIGTGGIFVFPDPEVNNCRFRGDIDNYVNMNYSKRMLDDFGLS